MQTRTAVKKKEEQSSGGGSKSIPQKAAAQKSDVRTTDISKLIQLIYDDPDTLTLEEFMRLQSSIGYRQAIGLLTDAKKRLGLENIEEKSIDSWLEKIQKPVDGLRQSIETFYSGAQDMKFKFDPEEDGKYTDWRPTSLLSEVVVAAGFLYDPVQDIIFSKMHPFQRIGGYAEFYDKAAPQAMNAIIDCEPIYFNYDGKDWMIELWKGQYGMETGAEIGIYNRDEGKVDVRDVAMGRFFDCVSDKELLKMSFTLFKNGKELFHRNSDIEKTSAVEKHWWLTGFKWGEFTGDPTNELTMDISITLEDEAMRKAFVEGLRNVGYKSGVSWNDTTVNFVFGKPYSKQTDSRAEHSESIQRNNKSYIESYNTLKQYLKMSSNDPNLIQENLVKKGSKEVEAAYDNLINYFKSIITSAFK
ncbi:MAG: DUF4474 domain-containing protein [Clostridia bacterium]|nr:DUF4474 domain-containing protein [Clostridia bacterium]